MKEEELGEREFFREDMKIEGDGFGPMFFGLEKDEEIPEVKK